MPACGSGGLYRSGQRGAAVKIYKGEIRNSLIAEGTVINGAKIKNSIIRSGVTIEKGVVIEDSIIMDGTVIRRNVKLRNLIVDKLNIIEEGTELGFDPKQDRFRCHMDPSGIAVLPKEGFKKKGRK